MLQASLPRSPTSATCGQERIRKPLLEWSICEDRQLAVGEARDSQEKGRCHHDNWCLSGINLWPFWLCARNPVFGQLLCLQKKLKVPNGDFLSESHRSGQGRANTPPEPWLQIGSNQCFVSFPAQQIAKQVLFKYVVSAVNSHQPPLYCVHYGLLWLLEL